MHRERPLLTFAWAGVRHSARVLLACWLASMVGFAIWGGDTAVGFLRGAYVSYRFAVFTVPLLALGAVIGTMVGIVGGTDAPSPLLGAAIGAAIDGAPALLRVLPWLGLGTTADRAVLLARPVVAAFYGAAVGVLVARTRRRAIAAASPVAGGSLSPPS
jgi:hypothetical protein